MDHRLRMEQLANLEYVGVCAALDCGGARGIKSNFQDEFPVRFPGPKLPMSKVSPLSTAENAAPSTRWQFRLWHLFALMTYVAVVVAVARKWGIETLPVTIGLGIAWLNYSGAIWFLQRRKLQLAVLFFAWGMFLGSLLLPTHTGWEIPGWLGAWVVLCAPVDNALHHDWFQVAKLLSWVPLIDTANLSQLLLPITAIRLRIDRGKFLAAVNCVSMVAFWTLAGPTVASGYVVWSISFLLVLTAMPLNRATLMVMHVTLASQIAFWLISGDHM